MSTVQDRPGSRCEEDWEAPWKTDETNGVQGEPQRRHGDGLSGSIRYSGFFHSSHITKCAYLFWLISLYCQISPDFCLLLIALNHVHSSLLELVVWSCHGMFCKVSGKMAELSLQDCCCSSWWKDQMCLQLSGDNYTGSLFIMLLQCIPHSTVANCCIHVVFE